MGFGVNFQAKKVVVCCGSKLDQNWIKTRSKQDKIYQRKKNQNFLISNIHKFTFFIALLIRFLFDVLQHGRSLLVRRIHIRVIPFMMTFDFCIAANCSIWISNTHSEALSLECCLPWLGNVFSKQNFLASCTSFGLFLTFGWRDRRLWTRSIISVSLPVFRSFYLQSHVSVLLTFETTEPLIKCLVFNEFYGFEWEWNHLMNRIFILLGFKRVSYSMPYLFVFHVNKI